MTEPNQKIKLPPVTTALTFTIIFGLLYLFFSKLSLKFYASILFFLYHHIQHMWLAVIGLGVVQTFIMLPLRIINLTLSANVKEFESEVEKVKENQKQAFIIKQTVAKGNPTLLWYIANFFIQTISYLSIGRMFLIDFYNTKLDPNLLFGFSHYPDYPIKDPIFKLPYPVVTRTVTNSWIWVFVAWAGILLYKLLHTKVIDYYRRLPQTQKISPDNAFTNSIKGFVKGSGGFLTLFFLIAYILIRHFPAAWDLRIFMGDVGVPNYTLNFITACGAFIIVLWLNLPKISKKTQIARQSGIPEDIVFKTSKQLFIDNLRSAFVLGLGAYYLTRLIPSAFELSIFTLEIISFLSPLTIDRLIFARFKPRKVWTNLYLMLKYS